MIDVAMEGVSFCIECTQRWGYSLIVLQVLRHHPELNKVIQPRMGHHHFFSGDIPALGFADFPAREICAGQSWREDC
jgi:hypothetical protein